MKPEMAQVEGGLLFPMALASENLCVPMGSAGLALPSASTCLCE